MKIDIHTHILPREIPSFKELFGYGGFIQLEHHKPNGARMVSDRGKFFREVDANCYDAAVRVEEMDALGLNVQVLSTVPVMFSYWAQPQDCLQVSRFLNDHIAAVVAQYPKRFVGLGTVPLHAPDLAVEELTRCVKELGLAGVQIGSHVNEWNLSEPALFPFYEAAESLNACIFVHPWDMMGETRMPKYWLPWLVGMPAETSLAICSMIFGGVLERFPKLRVAFAHAGGSFPATIGRIQHGFDARPDLCAIDNDVPPRDYCGRFWVDSLTHDATMLKHVVDLFGANRVALGTDYPFPLGEAEPGKLIEGISAFSAETRDLLLWKSAISWLGQDSSANLENLDAVNGACNP